MATSTASPQQRLAQQVRESFAGGLQGAVNELADRIQRHFGAGGEDDKAAGFALAQAHEAFLGARQGFIDHVSEALKAALSQAGRGGGNSDLGTLELVDDEVVERKIIASRLAAAISEVAGAELNELRLRLQGLQRQEMSARDILQPETYAQILLQAWADAGLAREMWVPIHAEAAKVLALRGKDLYHKLNAALQAQGIAPVDMRERVRRTHDGDGPANRHPHPHDVHSQPGPMHGPVHAGDGRVRAPTAYEPPAQHGGMRGAMHMPAAYDDPYRDFRGFGGARQAPEGAAEIYAAAGLHPATRHADSLAAHAGDGIAEPGAASLYHAWGQHMQGEARAGYHTQTPYVSHTVLARAAQETRMMTAMSPVARIHQRAQGVLGQLRRLVSGKVTGFDEAVPATAASSVLEGMMAAQQAVMPFPATEWVGRAGDARQHDVDDDDAVIVPTPAQMQARQRQAQAQVRAVADQLRHNAAELKEKAEKPSEKATIEIVALMFQAILAEERIPAGIRVWFARLQIPVLRLALAEPDFFASVQHPARQLIDRMGACVLGFDPAQVADSQEVEREIKRIVQIIEQYPETGRRVYQIVLDEFNQFLGKSLTEKQDVRQAVTLAQQVEQKEALSIQYTIELRRMLGGLPVPDSVREFLYRTWAEVLALSTVRHGKGGETTRRYKQAAADLLWSVSPKPSPAERSRVVQGLAALVQVLREGMELLAMPPDEQDSHIRFVNEAVKRAFLSQGEGMAAEKLQELSQALEGLEDEVTDDPEGDMLLDPGMIELMFGISSETLEVIAQGGSMPNESMRQWARELEVGAWFALEYHGKLLQVQYVWRSARGQLHLFSGGSNRSYLVQTRRLAAYLQAGLLAPTEDESLTVRATREALAKLNANPDQLLG